MAVGESPLGMLFEFSEDIETALEGVAKDSRIVCQAMRKAARRSPMPAEVSALHQALSELVGTDPLGLGEEGLHASTFN
jgi:hypothetical protein